MVQNSGPRIFFENSKAIAVKCLIWGSDSTIDWPFQFERVHLSTKRAFVLHENMQRVHLAFFLWKNALWRSHTVHSVWLKTYFILSENSASMSFRPVMTSASSFCTTRSNSASLSLRNRSRKPSSWSFHSSSSLCLLFRSHSFLSVSSLSFSVAISF